MPSDTPSLATYYELKRELSDISNQWFELGMRLNIPMPAMKEMEHDTVRLERRMPKLFQYWLKNETNPTWQKIVDALEGIGQGELASKLTHKYITTAQHQTHNSQPVESEKNVNTTTKKSVLVQTENGEVNPSEVSIGGEVVKVTEKSDIAKNLFDIENEFLKLESDIQGAVEGEFPLGRLRRLAHTITDEDFSECSTFDAVFDMLKRHYSFLRIRNLERLNKIVLRGSLSAEISKYTENLEKFISSCTVKEFKEIISTKAKPVNSNSKFQEVTLRLVGWEKMTMKNLEQLLRHLF